MDSFFISYRRNDSADVTGRIGEQLRQRFGAEAIFVDVDKMPFGLDFRETLERKLNQCSVLLAIIGRTWLTAKADNGARRLDQPDDIVRIEIETALARGIPVIPVLVHGISMPLADELPESLRPLVYRHAISVRAEPDFRHDMARLASGLESHLSDDVSNRVRASEPVNTVEGNNNGTRQAIVATLAGMLIALVSLLLITFFITDSTTPRTVGVVLLSLLGGALTVLGFWRGDGLAIGAGACALVVPWVLRIFLSPLVTMAVTMPAISVCAALLVWRDRHILTRLIKASL